MAKEQPIYWCAELTEEAKRGITAEFLADIFAPIIFDMMRCEAQNN